MLPSGDGDSYALVAGDDVVGYLLGAAIGWLLDDVDGCVLSEVLGDGDVLARQAVLRAAC